MNIRTGRGLLAIVILALAVVVQLRQSGRSYRTLPMMNGISGCAAAGGAIGITAHGLLRTANCSAEGASGDRPIIVRPAII